MVSAQPGSFPVVFYNKTWQVKLEH